MLFHANPAIYMQRNKKSDIYIYIYIYIGKTSANQFPMKRPSAAVQKDRSLLSRQRKELAQLQEKNKRIISPCQGIAS